MAGRTDRKGFTLIELAIVLVIVGLLVAMATAGTWRDWRLFRDTVVESSGKVIQRWHRRLWVDETGAEMNNSHWVDEFYFHVQFMNGETAIRLTAQVDGTSYAATSEGSSLVVRFAPSKPYLAQFRWESCDLPEIIRTW